MNKPLTYVIFIAFGLFLHSCFDEEFVPVDAGILRISRDTISFDTVFTTLGSTTLSFTISNPSDQHITIDEIGLEGISSMFRLNIDGVSANRANDIKVLPNDSIYVFVEVTVDPDQDVSVSPFVINDRVLISSSGGRQQVVLEAWGQNANYVTSKASRGKFLRLSCGNGTITWDDPKPYIINGILFVDSCTIVVPKGTKVYFHGGVSIADGIVYNDGGMIVLPTASMRVEGTADDPVVFQGDRLEPSYSDIAGQWSGLRFLSNSQNNSFSHTTIKNTIIGLRLDSAASVELDNVQVYNSSSVGIVGVQAQISMDNVLVHTNGGQSCAFVYGGTYALRHCTLANFGNQSPALYLDNFTCLDTDCNQIAVAPMNFSAKNSIMVGSDEDEIQIQDIAEGADPNLMQVDIDHSVIKVTKLKELVNLSDICSSCIEWIDQDLFLNENEQLYYLDTFSVAIDQGIKLEGLAFDILGTLRDELPDLGCYEFIK